VKFDQAQLFQIHQERNGADAVVVKLSGEFDMAGCASFETAVQSLQSLNGEPLRKVVIDLAELTFIDSSGIRSLLDSKRRAEEHGLALVVRVPEAGQVRQVLELTGVDHVLDGADGA
jgi:anti-sigma B factor antagonist